jgi:hypothetical protein
MAATHAPGTGIGPGSAGKHRWAAAVFAVTVLAAAAVALPFAVRGAHHTHVEAAPVASTQGPTRPAVHHVPTRSALGEPGELPPLLPSGRPELRDGQTVRVGDITEGTLRRTGAGWQVLVQWDGRLRPLPTRGPVALGDTSWLSASGLLYTRVPTGTTGRFHVYAWTPRGGNAYTPPVLVATALGPVCFDKRFTAFGDCSRSR